MIDMTNSFIALGRTATQRTTMNIEDIEDLAAYMSDKEADSFKGVKKERGDSYIIYWFVWEKDGIFDWPDWEPVVVVFCRQQLKCVSVRRHFHWERYMADDLVLPVTIFFEGRHHAPFVKTIANRDEFDRLVSKGVVRVPLDKSIDEEVPDFARDPRLLKKRYPSLSGTLSSFLHTISRQKNVDDWIKRLLTNCH